MKKELIEYDITIVAIEEMKKKYSGLKITDAKSDKAVRAARTLMVSTRTAVEKRRVELNADANTWRKQVNAKADEITNLLLPIEEPLQAECKRIDDEREAKRAEKEAKERERIEAIQEKINRIRAQAIGGHNVPSSLIQERIIITQGMPVGKDLFMEFAEQAEEVRKEAIAILKEALTQRLQLEKEDTERKAEAEHLEKVRKEQEAAQAKIDEENRKIELRQHEVEEKERKAEVRKAQQEFERQATIKAEQEAKEKGAREEQEKIEKEEAEAKEKARQEALWPDKEKLIKFAEEILDIKIPRLISDKANTMLAYASKTLNKLALDITKQAKEL